MWCRNDDSDDGRDGDERNINVGRRDDDDDGEGEEAWRTGNGGDDDGRNIIIGPLLNLSSVSLCTCYVCV